MTDNQVLKIISNPHVTEKSSLVASNNQYVFKVKRDANKAQIKNVVEKAFNVKVDAVRTLNVIGKTRRVGKTIGKRQDWKKAYVSLSAGYSIDLSNTENQKG